MLREQSSDIFEDAERLSSPRTDTCPLVQTTPASFPENVRGLFSAQRGPIGSCTFS